MSEEILARAEEYLARRRNRMRLLRAVTAMALVVAIMTSYVLMLPGLTLEAETTVAVKNTPTRRTATRWT